MGGFGNCQVGYFFDDPVEIGLAYGMEVGVGSGVHEVDGVGDAVFDSEFDSIEVVAERSAERQRIFLNTRRRAWDRRRAGSARSARGVACAGRRA